MVVTCLDHTVTSAILHICGLFPGDINRYPNFTPWKKIIIMLMVVILINGIVIGMLPADRVFENITRKYCKIKILIWRATFSL